MIHYIGDASFFSSFLKNPSFKNLFLFFKDINELKLRINNEKYINTTLFYVGDIAEIDEVFFHSGFYGRLEYLFVQFLSSEKRKEIDTMLSSKVSYCRRHTYLKKLYQEIMDSSSDFFVYSPPKIILNNEEDVILKDLSYFSLFTRKSILKDEDALLEKTLIKAKIPEKVFIADNKDNFIIEKK